MLTIEVLESSVLRVDASLAVQEDVPLWLPNGKRERVLDADSAYSIRIPRSSREVECPRCGLSFFAAGPTGFCAGEPVCDRCLFEGSAQLGMLLALASVTRGFGRLVPASQKHANAMLVSLGSFARTYESFASRFGPPRAFRVDFTDLGL